MSNLTYASVNDSDMLYCYIDKLLIEKFNRIGLLKL